ncbi:MAG TPA: DNA-3-methyladenine glycosylase 2 family protein [Flavisolibacter sp.]|jgi:DNA-3-methyladenine glycosylase II|nr:DNA-3-methyladenine glycosylase 2 family protein [Flavisolibacter sp.]
MIDRFTEQNFHERCDILIEKDETLHEVFRLYGYPPFWVRPNTFQTLVLTILEQQVSLASAFAAFKKLKERLGAITPNKVLELSDEELRSCYLSRQKIVYVRILAQALLSKEIRLQQLYYQEDPVVRNSLKQLKGIGDWTVDIYLMHALRRCDIFPIGDLALVNAIRMLRQDKSLTKETMMDISEAWKPNRSIATMILWHYYIKSRNIKLLH